MDMKHCETHDYVIISFSFHYKIVHLGSIIRLKKFDSIHICLSQFLFIYNDYTLHCLYEIPSNASMIV